MLFDVLGSETLEEKGSGCLDVATAHSNNIMSNIHVFWSTECQSTLLVSLHG
jgi:hypothetical protein